MVDAGNGNDGTVCAVQAVPGTVPTRTIMLAMAGTSTMDTTPAMAKILTVVTMSKRTQRWLQQQRWQPAC